MLAADVLPLLRRRVDDHPRRPGAVRMAAPVHDRRRQAHGSAATEVVFFFDQWLHSPLASLNRQLDESNAIAGFQSAHLNAAKATLPERLWTLGQQHGGARLLFVFDHFEQLLESPKEDANAQQFVEGWVQALRAPGLNANFLVVLDDHAWPRLKKLGERIPEFHQVQAFELQTRSGMQALMRVHVADAKPQAGTRAEPNAVDFEASLHAMLSEVTKSTRPAPVPGDFEASVDAVLFEVRKSARRGSTRSPAKTPGSAAKQDSRIAESIEASAETDAVRAAEANRVAQDQLAAEAEAARKAAQRAADSEAMRIAAAVAAADAERAAEAARSAAAAAQRVAVAEARRIAEVAAASEARKIADEFKRIEAERAAEAERVAQAQRAATAEAARRAQIQRAAEAEAEAKRIAEAAAAAEAGRIAEVADAAAAARAKVVAEAVELAAKAARESEARWAGYDSAPTASSAIAAATPGRPLRSAITWGLATLAVTLVVALLWPSERQRPAAPIAAAPATALDASSAPIQPGAPNPAAATAYAPPVTIAGALPDTTDPRLFTVRMNTAGSDARIASELARAIGGGAASARAVAAAAGVDAVQSLRAPRSLAIAQYDALRAARRSASAPPLRVLAPLYAEEVVFIVRADSRLKFIRDLRGRRINIGSAAEGSHQTVREIYLQMFGTAMAEPSQLGNDEALAELVAFRSIDAMVLIDAQPSAWLASLNPRTAGGLRLLRLDRKHPEDRRVLHGFQTSVLRSGPGMKKGEAIPTLSTMSYLAASGTDDADAEQLTDMVRALCRELPRLRISGHPKWRELRPSVDQDTGWPVVASAQSALKKCTSDRPAPASKPTIRRAPKSHSKR